jgi:hypothetical protein
MSVALASWLPDHETDGQVDHIREQGPDSQQPKVDLRVAKDPAKEKNGTAQMPKQHGQARSSA